MNFSGWLEKKAKRNKGFSESVQDIWDAIDISSARDWYLDNSRTGKALRNLGLIDYIKSIGGGNDRPTLEGFIEYIKKRLDFDD